MVFFSSSKTHHHHHSSNLDFNSAVVFSSNTQLCVRRGFYLYQNYTVLLGLQSLNWGILHLAAHLFWSFLSLQSPTTMPW